MIHVHNRSAVCRISSNEDNYARISESIGKGRFGDWLENIQDWGISRNRYWGTPLNVWQCECGHMESIGSRAELAEKSGDPKAAEVELHRPYIDAVTRSSLTAVILINQDSLA